MTRICILLPTHWEVSKGGAEYQAHCLADYLAQHTSHEVTYLTHLVSTEDNSYPYELKSFERPHFLRHPRWGLSPESFSLHRALTDLDPDVIVQIVASAQTGVAAWYAKRHRKLMFWYLASDMDVEPDPNLGIRGPAKKLDLLLFRYGARNATHILAQTQVQAERMRHTLGRDALAVIPNFHPPAAISRPKSAEFTVVWVANFKPLKRPELFLQLAQDFRDVPGIRFVMIGRSSESEWCRVILDHARQLPNLSYLGELDIEQVNQVLEGAHLFVNTSEYEGFPNTFIQAWMRCVPTLSLNVDPDGVMERERLGAQCGEYAILRDKLRYLSEHREEVRRMGDRARVFALEHYSMRNAARIGELIDAELGKQTRARGSPDEVGNA